MNSFIFIFCFIFNFFFLFKCQSLINDTLINYTLINEPVKPKLINGYKILCYYDANALLRKPKYRFKPEHINTTYCTHIVSTYATLDPIKYVIRESSSPKSNAIYHAISKLKNRESGLKTIIAIGGWQDSRDDKVNVAKYSRMAEDGAKRKNFTDSVMKFLKYYNFDGLSFEWQDPTFISGNDADKNNYVTLLKELKSRFGKRYELLVAISSSHDHRRGYDMNAISNIVDTISIMSFNYQGYWTIPQLIGHHSALYQRLDVKDKAPCQAEFNELGERRSVSVVSNFRYLLKDLKLDPRKLILGVPFFGRSFHLLDPNRNKPFDPFVAPGLGMGPHANLPEGMRTFSEICTDKGFRTVTDVRSWMAPYSFKDNFWIAHDDESSVKRKVNFMKSKNLAGILVYNIDFDDFLGECGAKSLLLRSVYQQVMRANLRQMLLQKVMKIFNKVSS